VSVQWRRQCMALPASCPSSGAVALGAVSIVFGHWRRRALRWMCGCCGEGLRAATRRPSRGCTKAFVFSYGWEKRPAAGLRGEARGADGFEGWRQSCLPDARTQGATDASFFARVHIYIMCWVRNIMCWARNIMCWARIKKVCDACLSDA
jgi:hypothetical protein